MASDFTYTPTYTPHNTSIHGQTQSVLSSTTQVLNSLVSFYQQERMWVYRMRAMLQEACTPQLTADGPDLQQANPDSTPDFSMESSQEYRLGDEPNLSDGQTRWMRRKREFKLRLEGIRSKRVNPLQFAEEEPVEQLRPREQILEMFEKMMEARMESCQRVNKLVEDASRENTHDQ